MAECDLISREEACKDSLTVQTREYGSIEVVPVDYLQSLEAADVQPVVHCKDCKYAQNPNDTMVYCTYFECGTMSQNDFCSQGEKL